MMNEEDAEGLGANLVIGFGYSNLISRFTHLIFVSIVLNFLMWIPPWHRMPIALLTDNVLVSLFISW